MLVLLGITATGYMGNGFCSLADAVTSNCMGFTPTILDCVTATMLAAILVKTRLGISSSQNESCSTLPNFASVATIDEAVV